MWVLTPGGSRSVLIVFVVFILILILFIVIVRVVERDDFDVVQALLLEEFDELFLLVLVHVDDDRPRDPLDRVLAALPDQPVLLPFMRADFELQDEPVIDAYIRDAELCPNTLGDLDSATVIGSLDVSEVGAEIFDEVICVLVLGIELVRLPIIQQVPDEVAQPFATVRIVPFGLALIRSVIKRIFGDTSKGGRNRIRDLYRAVNPPGGNSQGPSTRGGSASSGAALSLPPELPFRVAYQVIVYRSACARRRSPPGNTDSAA